MINFDKALDDCLNLIKNASLELAACVALEEAVKSNNEEVRQAIMNVVSLIRSLKNEE
jgi:starvation-inducible outer membrane lipoprotein